MASRNLLDGLTHRRTIKKQEEGCCLTSVAEKFGINISVVLHTWKALQTLGTAVRMVGGVHPMKTTAVDDQNIIM
ncbi:hypothetical protein TNCV_4330741 [Trichonephila clavipes]|nr:hypothetical protein TNCV_4330741 [Trichonephila clavipes]